MWIIEVNFAGRRFTHRVPDRRRAIYRLATRGFGWRPSPMRQTPAA